MKDQVRSIKFEATQIEQVNKSAAKADRTFAAQIRTLIDFGLELEKQMRGRK